MRFCFVLNCHIASFYSSCSKPHQFAAVRNKRFKYCNRQCLSRESPDFILIFKTLCYFNSSSVYRILYFVLVLKKSWKLRKREKFRQYLICELDCVYMNCSAVCWCALSLCSGCQVYSNQHLCCVLLTFYAAHGVGKVGGKARALYG